MAKVLPLEGPHKKHHSHGPHDSVPGKGLSAPKEHWEVKYNPMMHGEDKPSGISAFDPRCAKDRPCTHHKVNEQDH